METSVSVSVAASAGRSVFPIAFDAEHFAECEGQIVVEIQNAVCGKTEGSGYGQIYTAPETIAQLGNFNAQFVSAVDRRRLTEDKPSLFTQESDLHSKRRSHSRY